MFNTATCFQAPLPLHERLHSQGQQFFFSYLWINSGHRSNLIHLAVELPHYLHA